MNFDPVVPNLADNIERLQAKNPGVDLSVRIIHHAHLHFGYDDTKEEIPCDIKTESLELIILLREELDRREKCRKEEKFGVRVESTPDGTKKCHRGCYFDD